MLNKVLILGNSGFIGSNVKTFLNNNIENIKVSGISTEQADLTESNNWSFVENLWDRNKTILMASAIKNTIEDNIATYCKNMQMIANLCNSLQSKPAKRIIFLSSTAVYGDYTKNLSITEETAPDPNNYYSIAKLSGEHLLSYTIIGTNMSLVILRIPLVYGPGDNRADYGPNLFCKSALNNEEITLWGDGTEKREFIFIEDLVQIIINYIFGNENLLLNTISGKSYSYKEALDYISKSFKLNIIEQKRTRLKVDLGFISKKLLSVMPNLKFTTLEQGILKTIKWYNKNIINK